MANTQVKAGAMQGHAVHNPEPSISRGCKPIPIRSPVMTAMNTSTLRLPEGIAHNILRQEGLGPTGRDISGQQTGEHGYACDFGTAFHASL
jgi:hypothetical protein